MNNSTANYIRTHLITQLEAKVCGSINGGKQRGYENDEVVGLLLALDKRQVNTLAQSLDISSERL